MSRDIHMPLSIDDILIGEGRRAVNDTAVKRLAASIDEIGLRHPITPSTS
jgi:ParB-like chromosome segregation protein Spo0J